MIHHQSLDQGRIGVHFMLHLHHLDHVQVDRISVSIGIFGRADGEDGIGDIRGEFGGEGSVKFGGKGSVSDVDEGRAVKRRSLLE